MSNESSTMNALRRRLKTTERALRERNARLDALEAKDRERTKRDERERVAFHMAREAGLPDAGTRLMLTFAREQAGDLREFFQTITAAYAEGDDG